MAAAARVLDGADWHALVIAQRKMTKGTATAAERTGGRENKLIRILRKTYLQ
jgi:hypothetical protein